MGNSLGIFDLGPSARDASLGSYICEFSLGNFHLSSFARKLRLQSLAWKYSRGKLWVGKFRFGRFALICPFGNCRVGTLALDPSLRTSRLGVFTSELSLDNSCLGRSLRKLSSWSFTWKLSFEIFGLGTFVRDVALDNFLVVFSDWELWLGVWRLRAVA